MPKSKRPSDISGISTDLSKGVFQIIFSTPKKYNALSMPMYGHIGDLLRYASQEESIKLIYISGEGDFYSSGADLSSYSNPDSFSVKNLEVYRENIIHFVDSGLR